MTSWRAGQTQVAQYGVGHVGADLRYGHDVLGQLRQHDAEAVARDHPLVGAHRATTSRRRSAAKFSNQFSASGLASASRLTASSTRPPPRMCLIGTSRVLPDS